MQLCVLASGSKGNCLFIDSGSTRILVDAGLSAKQIKVRLAEIDICADSIEAVCITHDHSDHIRGVRVLQNRHGVVPYLNRPTFDVMRVKDEKCEEMNKKIFSTGSAFTIGDIQIEPFAISHDSAEPVGFIIKLPKKTIGVFTDSGMVTMLAREKLKACDVIILESNHDPDLLHNSDRPWSNKMRVAGRSGHISNAEAAELAVTLGRNGQLKHIFLAHLSEECNDSKLALRTTREALDENGLSHIIVDLAHQHIISTPLPLSE